MRNIGMRDVEAIRPSDDALGAQFTTQRREAIFQEVLQEGAGITPIHGRRRRWPAVAAAAVAGIAVLAMTTQILAPSGESVAEPPVQPTAATTAPTPLTPAPNGNGSALAMLGQVAVAAGSKPAIMQGSYLHVVTVAEQVGTEPRSVTFDDYVDANGWLWSHRTGSENYWYSTDLEKKEITSLPTDPEALDAELRSRGGSMSADERVFQGIEDILMTETTPPELRAVAITVLQRIAENPQAPETTNDGEIATPAVTVTTVDLPDSAGTGYRAAITDPTARPGVESWLILDATGQITETGVTSPDDSYTSTITVRERVGALPAEFLDVLGAEQSEQEVSD